MIYEVDPNKRLEELGITLPPPCKAAGNYRPAVQCGNLLYVSGHTPDDARPQLFVADPGKWCPGKVGDTVTPNQAYDAARDTALAILATVEAALGNLANVKRLVRATGLVNCTEGFTEHPAVMNGFSDLMAAVFGQKNGVGARSATGASSLPGNVPVEVSECIFEIG
jgi:enamine deaminase RidA (YjgF/YER057c/UK114 family)